MVSSGFVEGTAGLVDALTGLDSRLNVGLAKVAYSERVADTRVAYSERVADTRVAYDRIEFDSFRADA